MNPPIISFELYVLAIVLLLLEGRLFAAPKTTTALTWDYPASEVVGMTFKMYASTNLSGPYSMVTNCVGTNAVSVNLNTGTTFYYVTASNILGESDPSNVLQVVVARNGQNLRILVP